MSFLSNNPAPVAVDPLDAILSGGDAETEIAAALVDHQLQLSGQAVKAAAFLVAFGQAPLLSEILRLRRYQSGSKNLNSALDAVSLKGFMRGLSINLGGK